MDDLSFGPDDSHDYYTEQLEQQVNVMEEQLRQNKNYIKQLEQEVKRLKEFLMVT